MYHRYNIQSEWCEEGVPPFHEWILSWNGERPREGRLLFYIRIQTEVWSPFLLYASWGVNEQSSFMGESPFIRSYQDIITVGEGKRGVGFQVRIVPEGGASLQSLRSLHVYTNVERLGGDLNRSVLLPMEGLSQMALDHPRRRDLCSPTSVSAALHYFSGKKVDPLAIAAGVRDVGFDIYGNWVLNMAEASAYCDRDWWVERLDGFGAVHQKLLGGSPVIVSVRPPLIGSVLPPQSKGHLLVVRGYDAFAQRVHCMDPAFPTDEETLVSYPLDAFIEAWERRGNIAYVTCAKMV